MIQTGKGTIPVIKLIAIYSISALVCLCGLAISPILGDLKEIFHATDVEIQMITSLPALLMIPIVIISGKLSERINMLLVLEIGLLIFAGAGVLYLLSTKMWQLLAVSVVLGIGAGLVVPISTGMISKYFVGKYRSKQLGIGSSITNLVLILATIVTGKLAEINWHLPFVVYLFPLVTFFLCFSLRDKQDSSETIDDGHSEKETSTIDYSKFGKSGIMGGKLFQIMLFYLLATYTVNVIVINLSILLEEYHLDSMVAGTLMAVWFFSLMIPGFFINPIVNTFKRNTKMVCMLFIGVGLWIIIMTQSPVIMAIGCFINGLGFGTIQPQLYNKTTQTAIPEKTTLALAFMMSMNYLALLIAPYVIELFKDIFNIHTQQFGFIVNIGFAAILFLWALLGRKSFLFDDKVE